MGKELRLGEISVDVVFKDIKNVHLGVYPPMGRVRISAPERMSLEAIRLFAIGKLGWIKAQQRKLQAQDRETPREFLERESHYLWGKRYLLEIDEGAANTGVEVEHQAILLRVRNASQKQLKELLDNHYRAELKKRAATSVTKWEKRLGVTVERFYVQKMKTMWGSCNPARRTIRLNLELAKKLPECLDYVVLHEILHFFVQDHGEVFQALLDQHMPGWPTTRKKLNEAPLAHADWTL